MQAPIRQEVPLLLEMFGIISGHIQPQELAWAEVASWAAGQTR